MVEKKPENIMRNPKFGFLLYADAYAAMVLESKPTVDQEGKDVIEFELSPTDELIKDYNLKPIPPREDYVYKVQLPVEFLLQLNPSPHFTRWFYLKTYNGAIPPQIRKLLQTELLQEVMDLKEAIRRKDMEIDVANENLELMRTNLPAYMKKNVFEIMKEAAPIFEKLMPDKKKDGN
jgi:hypothetical protein